MLLDFNKSLDEAWKDIRHEIHRGALDSKHPYRFITLTTLGKDQIHSRWVVLRQVDDDLKLYIYSDYRTDKIRDIEERSLTQILLYHDKKKLQIRMQGDATVHHQNELARSHWKNVQGIGKRAYTPLIAPGSPIEAPEDAHQWPENYTDEHFSVVTFEPIELDILQLNRMEHLRARFRKSENEWNKSWIAP